MGSAILPALDSGMSKDEAKELAGATTSIFYLSKQVNELHTALEKHMDKEDENNKILSDNHAALDLRMNNTQVEVTKIWTHLAWIKGIFVAFKASIVSWLIHKG